MCGKAKRWGWLILLLFLFPGKSEGQDHNRQFIDVSGDITGLTARVIAVEAEVESLKDKITRDLEDLVGRIEKLEDKPAPTPVAEVVKGNFPAPANQAVKSGSSSGSFQKIPQSSASGPYANFPVSSGPHWTYPGSHNDPTGVHIKNHLANEIHGINTSGMSKEQMLSLHDSLHEGRVSNTQPTPVQQTTYSTRSYSTSTYRTCPPGGCPSERRGIFGRRKG